MVTNTIQRKRKSLKEKRQKEHVLLYKILYSLMIMLVYMIGRNIPLYGIDLKAYEDVSVDAQSILLQALSGDMKNCSLFILGLWPYMIASILAVLLVAIISLDSSRKISPRKLNIWTLFFYDGNCIYPGVSEGSDICIQGYGCADAVDYKGNCVYTAYSRYAYSSVYV